MAAENLVVLVFEDLHWADPGQLDFIDHMLEWSRNVPILIVTLARPELLEKRSDWGAGRRNFLALDLEPLDDVAMRELLAGFVPGLSEAAVRSIVARAEGIPLYAVETIRMLVADGRLQAREEGGFEPVGELGELAVPDTLHALIAARLDGLEPDERSLIQDAAVLGQSFTPAGLSAVSGLAEGNLAIRLRALVRSDLLIEEVDPRSPERGQFAFVQALIREVAYSTLSLKDRRARHLAAARFFESIGDDELAGALASHYLAAYRASPAGDEAAALATQARLALRGASERAAALGSQLQSLSFLEQAIDITTDDAEVADLLERAIETATFAAMYDSALGHSPRLQAIREAAGDKAGLAVAISLEVEAYFGMRQRERSVQLANDALPRFEDLGDHPALLRLVANIANAAALTRQYELAATMSDRALGMAERMGDADVAARMLSVRGSMALFRGRLWEAIALTEGARHLAEQHGLSTRVSAINGALSNVLALDDPRATLAVEKEIIANARRLGRREAELVTLGNAAEDARRTGEWDWVFAEIERSRRPEASGADMLLEVGIAVLRTYRGQMSEEERAAVLARIDALDDVDAATAATDIRAVVGFLAGDYAAAAREWVSQADRSDLNAPFALPKAGLAAVIGGDVATAAAALDRLAALGARGRAIEADILTIRSGIQARAGDGPGALAGFRQASAAYRDLGLPWDQTLLALVAGATLGASDPEVAGWLGEARLTFERLRTPPMIAILDGFAASVWSGRETRGAPAPADEASGIAAT
jgi:hypothetical protein